MDDLTTWDVLVGKIKGRWDKALLKIEPISVTPGRFDKGNRLCAAQGDKRQVFEILHSRKSGHSYIIDCGLTSTEAAEALMGAQLFIHPSMRPALPPGEFYLDELIGLRVLTETGEEFGEIQEVLETPAHNVYVTPVAMIPAVPEFIVSTDWEKRELVIHDVPGLRIDE